MTAGTSEPGPWTWRLAPLRHYVIPYLLVSFAYQVFGTIFLADSALWNALGWIPTVAVVPILFAMFAHMRIPACSRCLAEMPLDGSEQAERHATWLWFSHRWGLVLGSYAAIFVVSVAPSWIFGRSTATAVMLCGSGLGWLPMFRAFGLHDRLRPWCPWCRRGRDDDDETAPAPQPVPVGVKER